MRLKTLILALIVLAVLIAPAAALTTYGGIHISGITEITASHARLTGSVDSPATNPIAWFVIGAHPGGPYTYRTANLSTGTGTYSLLIESYPLIAGQTYYARAACPLGYSDEVAFTMLAAGAAPTTTYGARANDFQTTNMSLLTLWEYTLQTGGETFGGGDAGVTIFISLIGAVAFIVLFGRAGDVIIPLEIGVLTIGIIIPLLAPEFAEIGYGLMVAAVIGVIYSVFRKVV